MNWSRGLEGIVAGETAISNVEGEVGRLSYRGYAIEDLVEQDYAAVMWLLLFGELPSPGQQSRLEDFLSTHGELTEAELGVLRRIDPGLHPMRVVQAMLPLLLPSVDDFEGIGQEGARGLAVVARMPALIATRRRLLTDGTLPPFDANVDYLRNFLMMFTGRSVTDEEATALRVVQILQMEHSFNAGTFTARVVASTLAPIEAVFSAAVGALSGILHGGADEAALNDAKTVAGPEAAVAWVDDLLARGDKLMGMGHREYRKVDPRALILKPMAAELCEGTPQQPVFDILVALEAAFNRRMAERGKEVHANLEFYKGPVYEVLGIPSDYFTAVFAMSRMVGWLAHFLESRTDNRIIRPQAAYTGPAPRKLQVTA